MSDNKEFFELLKSVANEQTFALELSPGKEPSTVACRQLTTNQLKQIIKSVVDSPLTQFSFNTACTNVFKQSLVILPIQPLNVLDRLLFLIQTRIYSLSPITTLNINGNDIKVDFKEILSKLSQKIKDNRSILGLTTATEDQITIGFGIALLEAEHQLNEELYKDFNPDTNNLEELRSLLGETFIHEIAKTVQTITIGEKTLNLSTISFKNRIEAIESLPASLIQKVIEYIEKYKEIVNECLTVDGHLITLDASLFSVR